MGGLYHSFIVYYNNIRKCKQNGNLFLTWASKPNAIDCLGDYSTLLWWNNPILHFYLLKNVDITQPKTQG